MTRLRFTDALRVRAAQKSLGAESVSSKDKGKGKGKESGYADDSTALETTYSSLEKLRQASDEFYLNWNHTLSKIVELLELRKSVPCDDHCGISHILTIYKWTLHNWLLLMLGKIRKV
jgi:vacuolar-type H+-ATPase subunit I/STV1